MKILTLVDGPITEVEVALGIVKEIEVDFGEVPVSSKSFTIADLDVSLTSKIFVSQSGNQATDRIGNDWEVDSAIFSAVAKTEEFILSINSIFSLLGKRKVFYQIL